MTKKTQIHIPAPGEKQIIATPRRDDAKVSVIDGVNLQTGFCVSADYVSVRIPDKQNMLLLIDEPNTIQQALGGQPAKDLLRSLPQREKFGAEGCWKSESGDNGIVQNAAQTLSDLQLDFWKFTPELPVRPAHLRLEIPVAEFITSRNLSVMKKPLRENCQNQLQAVKDAVEANYQWKQKATAVAAGIFGKIPIEVLREHLQEAHEGCADIFQCENLFPPGMLRQVANGILAKTSLCEIVAPLTEPQKTALRKSALDDENTLEHAINELIEAWTFAKTHICDGCLK